MDARSPLVRALLLLQQFPLPLLLPAIAVVLVSMAINPQLAQLTLPKFTHFMVFVAGMLVHFLLTCVAFICIANYTARNESNGEKPELRNIFDSLGYPGYGKLLAALLVRFALTLVLVALFTVLLITPVFATFRAISHHLPPRAVSGEVYLWVATVIAVAILARWVFAIPLFAQSKGLLKTAWETSIKVVRGRTLFVVFFTLVLRAVSYPFVRLTSSLHPHLSEGAAHYVPQLFEIFAAYGLRAAIWAYWMIVMTLLAMQLQAADASDSAFSTLPVASA